ncbi:DUF2314 domain-containing protein [Roseovarius faecimaris]|uniref:DUF2314 domain-containing protein n=1 Tax=Roseovarius faecimaris TaxID=2494550 RepID=A0A6I6IRZ8_9RHOB|nr:DUF2314 domain-containing protein [Roseovarius faecimaris]QGX98952.1 DUF2314 domain-containing protein [Roseovarius faecimaris]
MMRLFLLAATVAGLTATAPARAADPVVDFATSDAEMQAAVARATDSLDLFLRHALDAQSRSVPDAGVKVIVPIDDTLAEVIWVAPFARTGQSFFGYLQNEPEHMEGYQVGDSIRFGQDQIADWYLSRDGKVFGNFTTRVMLPHLSEEDRAWLSEMLSDQPIPSDW